jgi:hypothetical protein
VIPVVDISRRDGFGLRVLYMIAVFSCWPAASPSWTASYSTATCTESRIGIIMIMDPQHYIIRSSRTRGQRELEGIIRSSRTRGQRELEGIKIIDLIRYQDRCTQGSLHLIWKRQTVSMIIVL